MSSVVTRLDSTSAMLMMTAAVVRSLRAPAIRPSGRRSVSLGAPTICGITATPVSKPERPSASLGNTSRATPTTASQLGCCVVSRRVQAEISSGCVATSASPTATTTALSAR